MQTSRGIDPFRSVRCKRSTFNFVQFPKSAGISPVIGLLFNSKYSKSFSLPTDELNEPEKPSRPLMSHGLLASAVSCKNKLFSFFNSYMPSGSLPNMEFPLTLNLSRSFIFPMPSGSEVYKKLSSNRRCLRLRRIVIVAGRLPSMKLSFTRRNVRYRRFPISSVSSPVNEFSDKYNPFIDFHFPKSGPSVPVNPTLNSLINPPCL
mmetsp:Transcript_23880/g.34116  ORF Transcript_23880/g.34116 Transcript_23880/m.34116 type:complete len:205 (+) Transcript_23880:277-891(+)